MSITREEVMQFVNKWFHAVGAGADGAEQAKFHVHPQARIFAGNGESFSLDEHHKLHQQWCDESHSLGELELTPINDSPSRVRVNATVYWEAKFCTSTTEPSVIKAVVGENWIIEKTSAGLRFVLYISSSFHLLPGSALLGFK